jgi:lactoylglutathione lyase
MNEAVVKPDFRLDHTMIRVFDQDKTLDFYTRVLGMKILRQTEYPDGRFTNTFIGYQDEDDGTSIEMTYNWDQLEPYDMGNAWGHFALKVSDVYATAEYLKSEGVEFVRDAGPMNAGTRIIAFFKDPNGYVIELNEPVSASN